MKLRTTALLGTTALLAVAGCSVTGGSEDDSATDDTTVTLLTHDSFALPDELLAEFEEHSGLTLEVVRSGDAGSLTNQLVLSKDEPVGDAVFGIDNTFASRAVDAGVLAEHVPDELPGSAADHALDGDGADRLTPVDWGDVCVNVDDTWFRENDVPAPKTLDDLTEPAYRDLFVTPAPNSSSPGFAFLLATIGEYGEDGWQEYWQRLVDNGVRVVAGWTDAYEVDFTAGGGGGDRPIVLSYNSSPPFTIPEGGKRPTTSALLDTCFRQVEYAGVLEGADNPEGAQEVVDFLVSPEVQAALPDSMYVFPVDDSVELPPLWAKWAEPAPAPVEVDPEAISEHREEWLREWSDVTS
ncbi:thiamine ABC transporter substrate-binding protein [Nocardioides caldifontis]|uniref:thiamine ABC transporter substrate-binding protein n=1 Tax=Nocardioides caldifontis TaxID=2588938 RepID=UPI0011DF920B|nr:thiamine ABC transporter substrate-binding protein [Nocardioides caldifontis]